MSNEKGAPSCLGYLGYNIGNYTTHLYGGYSEPLSGSLLNNQYNRKYVFFSISWLLWENKVLIAELKEQTS